MWWRKCTTSNSGGKHCLPSGAGKGLYAMFLIKNNIKIAQGVEIDKKHQQQNL